MNLTAAKDLFLNDATNKQRFVENLGQDLEAAGCKVFYASADADVLIVQKALESSDVQDTILVGDDTDLLVLAIYHSKNSTYKLIFAPELKKNAKQRIWDISKVKKDLGMFSCKHILFQHAFLGCDTTSRLFGIGKGSILKKFKANSALQQAADVFDSTSSTLGEIESAGEKAMVAIYNGKKDDTLNGLRLTRYCKKVAKSFNKVEPRSLPPTSSAAKYHSYRVFLQICQWKGKDCDFQPGLWGWNIEEGEFYPTPTDQPPAPLELLKIIHCNCTTDCNTTRCSCQKHGMKCSLACGHCRGSGCVNASPLIAQDEDEDEIE